MPKKFAPIPKLKQLIHVAKNELRFDDETYRDVLESVTGKRSTTQMTQAQLNAVLDRFKQSGFTVKTKSVEDKTGVKNLASDDQSKLIRHLWLLLHDAGQVRNSSEIALAKFVENKVGVSALQFLGSNHADMIIKHLRQWCKRAGIERVDTPKQTTIIVD